MWGLEVLTRAASSFQGHTDYFSQASSANLSEGAKAREGTISAAPKLSNYHLGCGKPFSPPWTPGPSSRGWSHWPPQSFAKECRGRWWGEQPWRRCWEGNQLESRSLMK